MLPSEIKFHRGSWLVTMALIAIAVIHIVFAYLPGRKLIDQSRREIECRRLYITDSANVSATLAAAQLDLATAKSYIENWRQVAATTHRLPVLYGTINNLSKQAGITTTRFEPQMVVELGTIRQIPIHMACTGSFAQIHEFISSLESLPQTIWMDTLRFEKTGQTGEYVLCEINMVIYSDNPNFSNYADNSK